MLIFFSYSIEWSTNHYANPCWAIAPKGQQEKLKLAGITMLISDNQAIYCHTFPHVFQ